MRLQRYIGLEIRFCVHCTSSLETTNSVLMWLNQLPVPLYLYLYLSETKTLKNIDSKNSCVGRGEEAGARCEVEKKWGIRNTTKHFSIYKSSKMPSLVRNTVTAYYKELIA